jgi:signal transduction histidine kinase
VSHALRSVLDEPRAPAAPGAGRRDWVLVAAVAVAATLEATQRADMPLPWLSWLVAVGLSPTLLWRRTHPFAVVAVVFGGLAVLDTGLIVADAPATDMYSMIYFLLLPYALFRWASGREALAGLAIILVPASISLFVSWAGIGDAIGGLAVLFASMAIGVAVRSQRGARDRQLEQVKTDERVQLARELHDTMAHHVSAIAIQAQAGRALGVVDPSSALDALGVIEEEASLTLAEMRTMVRVLRNQAPADFAPQPGVAELEALGATRTTGPPVRVAISGDLVHLPAAVDAALFRIAQEAVTNALRHARNPTLVAVRVDGDEAGVRLEVHDDGDPTTPASSNGPGFGITGMVERAALLGGSCSAGPLQGGGWAVRATLPRAVPQ